MVSDSSQYYWCSFQARQSSSIIIQYLILLCQLIILLLMTYAYIKAKKQNQFDRMSRIYKFCVAWLICFFIKTLVNIIAYFVYIDLGKDINQSNTYKSQSTSNQNDADIMGLRVMSAIFLFLDVMTTYLLQFNMIYIPFLWMKNSLDFLSVLSDKQFTLKQRISINKISILLQTIQKYVIFRLLYVIYFLGISLAIIFYQNLGDYGSYITIVSLVQSIIIFFIYVIGLYAYNLFKSKLRFRQKYKNSMKVQYLILFTCNVIRIFLLIIFYFSNLTDYQPNQYCYDDHSQQDIIMNCILLIFGFGFMHILPGTMILYIYWPSINSDTSISSSFADPTEDQS